MGQEGILKLENKLCVQTLRGLSPGIKKHFEDPEEEIWS